MNSKFVWKLRMSYLHFIFLLWSHFNKTGTNLYFLHQLSSNLKSNSNLCKWTCYAMSCFVLIITKKKHLYLINENIDMNLIKNKIKSKKFRTFLHIFSYACPTRYFFAIYTIISFAGYTIHIKTCFINKSKAFNWS